MATQADLREFLSESCRQIADAWTEFAEEVVRLSVESAVVFAWLLLAMLSPVWLIPYLVYRRLGGQND